MNSYKIIAEKKGQMTLLELDILDPGEGKVQVQAVSSVVSPGTERAFILALENTSHVFPLSIGYSCSGIVKKVGPGVTSFVPGDKVAGVVAHQSLTNVPASSLVKIPEGVTFDQAAFVHVGVIAMQAVRKARIELGEAVVVMGVGLIGQHAMQLAKANGASQIICIDKVPSKLALAKRLGADVIINSSDDDWLDQVLAATEGQGAPVVIESTGFPVPIANALLTARKFGRVVLLGSTRGCTEVNFYRDVHKKALTIIGAHITSNPDIESFPGYWTTHDNSKVFLNLIQAGRVDVLPLISEKRPFMEYDQIYKRVLGWDKDYVTTIIDWSAE